MGLVVALMREQERLLYFVVRDAPTVMGPQAVLLDDIEVCKYVMARV
jgi:hypothetical protein